MRRPIYVYPFDPQALIGERRLRTILPPDQDIQDLIVKS